MFGRNKSRQSPQPEIGSLNSINNRFQNVAITSDHQSPCNFVVPDFSVGSVPFVFTEIPVSVVLSHLQSLNPRKSTGPDGLSARFLKEVSTEIAPALTDLFNISLSSGVFPSEWKRSHITPIQKGGPSDDPSNFRPISVVPVLAKILEKIVSIQLSSYLEQRSLLHPHQGAYRCGRSTEDILLAAVDCIVQSLDAGHPVCAAFLDFRKAFDSLDHVTLLTKLHHLNLSPQVLVWFKDYLSDRQHSVDSFSDWAFMKGGIPQDSALGPLLFLIYVNDLSSQVTGGLLLQYADDTTIICSAPTKDDVASLMNSQLKLIDQWTSANKMTVNYSKSSVMWFRVSNRRLPHGYPPIMMDDVILSVVPKQKYLGLIFDERLTWYCHVSKVCKSMSYYLHLLCKHRHVLTDDFLKTLAESLLPACVGSFIATLFI